MRCFDKDMTWHDKHYNMWPDLGNPLYGIRAWFVQCTIFSSGQKLSKSRFCHMWANLKKGVTSRISRILVLKRLYLWNHSIAATNFKPGMSILPSSYYTRYKSWALPTSGIGGASTCVNRVRKMQNGPLWRLTARDRRLALASNVGFVK